MKHAKKESNSPFRYPGVQPFSTGQSQVFFGRDRELADLYRLVRREQLVVLYSKSGLGKSSLLNAGLIPLCRKEGEYHPIAARFGAWKEGEIETPLGITRRLLASEDQPATFLSRLLPEDHSLWRHAKARQLNGGGRPLILFDQFEELFTYPEDAVRTFQQDLAELLYTDIPLRFRRQMEAAATPGWTEADEDRLEESLGVRVLFAIRSDRMHLLHQLTGYLPNVLRHLYELRALRPEDAEAAIVRPAALPADAAGEGREFRTPPFHWSPAALERLLAYLRDEANENRVEGILLQLICQYLEEKKVAGEGRSQIDAEDLGDLENIVENYYFEKIASLGDEAEQSAARRLIEEGLVMEGEKIRLSMHEAQIERQFGVGAPLLSRLVDSRLLRAEPFLRGGYTYELAHDRLVKPVLKAKRERQGREALRAAEAREQELVEERRKRQRARRIAIIASILALVAISAMVAAIILYRQANQSKEEAQRSLCRALDEQQQRYELEAAQLRQDAESFRKAGETLNKAARLQQADSLDRVREEILKQMENCEE